MPPILILVDYNIEIEILEALLVLFAGEFGGEEGGAFFKPVDAVHINHAELFVARNAVGFEKNIEQKFGNPTVETLVKIGIFLDVGNAVF